MTSQTINLIQIEARLLATVSVLFIYSYTVLYKVHILCMAALHILWHCIISATLFHTLKGEEQVQNYKA